MEEPCLILRSVLVLVSFFPPCFIPEEPRRRCWATVHQKPVRHPLRLSSALTCPFKYYKVVIYHPVVRKSAGFESVKSKCLLVVWFSKSGNLSFSFFCAC